MKSVKGELESAFRGKVAQCKGSLCSLFCVVKPGLNFLFTISAARKAGNKILSTPADEVKSAIVNKG